MTETEKDLWESLLDAEMNVEYWGHVARRYANFDLWFKIFVAITSSTSVASLQVFQKTSGSSGWHFLWDVCAGVAVVAAVALPFLAFDATARSAATQRTAWFDIKNAYNDLWLRRDKLKPDSVTKKLAEIKLQESESSKPEATLPRIEKLLLLSQNQVCSARGLPSVG